MLRCAILASFLFSPLLIWSQFDIAPPVINDGLYAITDTLYMDPNGNDSAPGTFDQPVKSFSVAVQKLPYGMQGINGGNAYGLIMLKAGHYDAPNGFQQYENTWQNGNVFRNVSIEGIGDVMIGGTADSFATGHLIVLSGDHIFIRNIRLQYSTGIGILLSRNEGNTRQKHVFIEDVVVDSVGSFSMLLRNVDTILIRNCRSLYASRPGSAALTSPCQWPSGIKFFNSTECTIYDSEIAWTRGEGLNFHNSRRGQAFRNKLHDNGLNFYNDNSTHLAVHHNLIYNTPAIGPEYWRNCPADSDAIRASGGMLIANEGACDQGNLPVSEGCATRCILPAEVFPNVDSMFVYNNIFQNTGTALGFWQGSTAIAGVNCIRNVFVFNNTFIGSLAMPGASSAGFVNVFFPDYNVLFSTNYSYLQNVRITSNVFTYDTQLFDNLVPVNMVFHPLHPGPKDITFDGNLWIAEHGYMGPNDLVRPDMQASTSLLTDSITSILPCDQNPEWIYSRPLAFPFLTDDYSFESRLAPNTNVGALEFDPDCMTVSSGWVDASGFEIELFPNPCYSCESLTVRHMPDNGAYRFGIYTMTGIRMGSGAVEGSAIHLGSPLPAGIYIVLLQGNSGQYAGRIIIY